MNEILKMLKSTELVKMHQEMPWQVRNDTEIVINVNGELCVPPVHYLYTTKALK